METEFLALTRACDVVQVPWGSHEILPEGTRVRITQVLGNSFTVTTEYGTMVRVDGADADALGLDLPGMKSKGQADGKLEEKMVWAELKDVFDPEIPVSIVDLGLIYKCEISEVPDGKKITVRMSMTSPGCGMGDVLKADVEGKLQNLPEVRELDVQVVFDPPWNLSMMSPAARLQLGLDV